MTRATPASTPRTQASPPWRLSSVTTCPQPPRPPGRPRGCPPCPCPRYPRWGRPHRPAPGPGLPRHHPPWATSDIRVTLLMNSSKMWVPIWFCRHFNKIFSLFQLYEIDDNPRRTEFLDDLFSFMQKRGQPELFRTPIIIVFVRQIINVFIWFRDTHKPFTSDGQGCVRPVWVV